MTRRGLTIGCPFGVPEPATLSKAWGAVDQRGAMAEENKCYHSRKTEKCNELAVS